MSYITKCFKCKSLNLKEYVKGKYVCKVCSHRGKINGN